ncbi:MAG: VOC family protein [Reichenbachiella sp.]|uniref:VOC family protein n=1 Tax=Reichenbachiella sp. TaxID=2184521 RepID=UPI00326631B6
MNSKKISLHHIAIMVENLEEALEFYHTLGFEDIETPQSAYNHRIRWLQITDECSLHIIETPPLESIERVHFAISVSDINEWRDYITDRGLYIKEQSIELYGVNRFFLSDPSDNLIEFLEVERVENKNHKIQTSFTEIEAGIPAEKINPITSSQDS